MAKTSDNGLTLDDLWGYMCLPDYELLATAEEHPVRILPSPDCVGAMLVWDCVRLPCVWVDSQWEEVAWGSAEFNVTLWEESGDIEDCKMVDIISAETDDGEKLE